MIYVLMSLISFITIIFLYMGHLHYLFVLETIVDEERDVASKIYTNTFQLVTEHYESVANSILVNDNIIDAFERGDRKELLRLTAPIYRELVAQNPHLNIMHFHTKESRSFLRLHEPEKFGDDLSHFRYMINRVNREKKKQIGMEVGRYGINYRVALPVFNKKGDHIGSFEFGIDMDYIFDIFSEDYGIESIIFVNKDVFKIIHKNNKKLKYLSFNDHYYIINPKENCLSSMVPASVLSDKYVLVNCNGVENMVFLVTDMKSVLGENIGKIVFVKNMDGYAKQIAIIRGVSIALAVILILFSFYLLRKILNRYAHVIHTYQSQLEIKNRTLMKMSNIDHLTKAYNRRCIENIFKKELRRAARYSKPLSVIILDIDNFKTINDTYGHNSGDKVLKNVAKIISGMIRETDHFGRWGGEEFLILATETSLANVAIMAEQIRAALDLHDFLEPHNVTCSIGVAEFSGEENPEDVVAKADSALYEAKKTGKNKVVSFPFEP